jgi:hypothetical protein
MKDAEVKDKLENLSALSGGLVFAREEAWEKLQTRLDKPAKKVIMPWYKLAATAAVLLLALGIYIYTHPATAPVTNNMATATPQENREAPPAPAAPQNAYQAPATAETIRISLPKPKTVPGPTYTIDETNRDCIVQMEYPEQPVAQITQPPTKKMRLVHINELGNEEENTPALDISKMKIVSIYDVQHQEQMRRQEEEILALERLNRPHSFFVAASLSRHRNTSLSANLFSIQLNRKN